MRMWPFTKWAGSTTMDKYAREAVRAGFAVVFLRPGGKEPICPLTARDKRAAGPRHACGVAHASKDEKWVVNAAKRLERDYGRINLGIAARASGVVVIDADTPEQVESVQALLAQLGEDETLLGGLPTVQTPGVERDGVWVHHGGTHWYFNVPDELELPAHPAQMALVGGAVMRWGDTYTVVPPSERPEGRYLSLTERIPDVPVGLVALMRERAGARAVRDADWVARYRNDPVAEWSVQMPWHELLEPEGWHFMGKLDHQCGCPVWRRPGEDSTTDRSAIAHENECERMPNVEGHGPLYVFSDNVPGPLGEAIAGGQRTFTKLQFISLVQYEGDESRAQVELGLVPDYSDMWSVGQPDSDPDPYTSEVLSNCPTDDDSGSDQGEQGSEPLDKGVHPLAVQARALSERTGLSLAECLRSVGEEWKRREVKAIVDAYSGEDSELRDGSTWLPVRGDLLATLDAPMPPASDGALERSDGAMLFTFGRLHQLFGQSESGKTWLMMTAMVQLALRGKRSLYCDFEDTRQKFIDRFRTGLGIDVRPWVAAGLIEYVNPLEPPTALAVDQLIGMEFDLIVVDSLSEVVASINDGSMRDGPLLRRVLRKFRAMADARRGGGDHRSRIGEGGDSDELDGRERNPSGDDRAGRVVGQRPTVQ